MSARRNQPRSGDYPTFLKWFFSLKPQERRNVYLSFSKDGAVFHFALFPSAVCLPAESEELLKPAMAVAELVDKYAAKGTA